MNLTKKNSHEKTNFITDLLHYRNKNSNLKSDIKKNINIKKRLGYEKNIIFNSWNHLFVR